MLWPRRSVTLYDCIARATFGKHPRPSAKSVPRLKPEKEEPRSDARLFRSRSYKPARSKRVHFRMNRQAHSCTCKQGRSRNCVRGCIPNAEHRPIHDAACRRSADYPPISYPYSCTLELSEQQSTRSFGRHDLPQLSFTDRSRKTIVSGPSQCMPATPLPRIL